jgi:uncharacterized protein (DUF1501 family)
LPYRVPSSGQFGLEGYAPEGNDPFSVALSGLINEGRADLFEAGWLHVLKRATDNQRILTEALNGKDAATAFPQSDLGGQLKMVARLISARGNLGLKRQCFFCSMGGFDTHGDDQRGMQQQKFAEIDEAVKVFVDEMAVQGLSQQVTLFTASDFGRTLVSNSKGSDHGWGNHHLVIGGGVQGGKLHGRFPDHTVGGPDDIGGGNWIPALSLDQVGAELARWFGVTGALGEIFPNVGNFDTQLGLFKA